MYTFCDGENKKVMFPPPLDISVMTMIYIKVIRVYVLRIVIEAQSIVEFVNMFIFLLVLQRYTYEYIIMQHQMVSFK